MPAFINIGQRLEGVGEQEELKAFTTAGFFGNEYGPMNLPFPEEAAQSVRPPKGMEPGRFENRDRLFRKLIDASPERDYLSDHQRESLLRSMDNAYRLLSAKERAAFDIALEPKESYAAYDTGRFGRGCLLARRLVESGVKFVNVYFDESIGGQNTKSGGWDTHGFNNTRMYPIIKGRHLPITDHTLPVLINDLDDRGLLDSTLIVWMGEFGRSPKLNDNISRDHWPQCYTVLLAGGGVKGGATYGASDKNGGFPARDPVSLGDLSATMFESLGIAAETEMRDALNRPFPVSAGRAVREILV
jgi:hypothetical protein